DDKERQQQEMMRFYKENKVNPLGSCLPMVAQIPVFISLFYMLRQSLRADICPGHQPTLPSGAIDMAHLRPCGVGHGAGFLFVGDLTNKATGITLIVLIVLYIGTQLASSLMMSSATMDKTQRQIMLFMPLIFVLFVINFPAGVIVYWITTNAWTMGQQFVIKRRIGPVTAGAAAPGPPGPAAAIDRGSAKDKGTEKTTNGSGPRAGLGDLIRGRTKPEGEKTGVAAAAPKGGPPPRSPRKKKKRSGRRR
ncbi:MAG: YidC/Oxa1 family membrane protein insertase, partial [Actinomycetota bacterium]|nr:YidC/Oxa1 family membrane protein insertase [Actinomycetota bacterium]